MNISIEIFNEALELFSFLCNSILNNKTIKSIKIEFNNKNKCDLYNCYKNFTSFFHTLKNNKEILKLDLSNNTFFDNDMYSDSHLLKLFNNIKFIKSLKVPQIKLDNSIEKVKKICSFLSINKSLLRLDLSGNNLGTNPDNINFLCQGLSDNKIIQKLNLNNNLLGKYEQNLIYISNFLASNSSITKFDISFNILFQIKENMGKFFDKFINNEKKNSINIIKNLDISNNSIGLVYGNIDLISKVFSNNKNLKNINLSKNSIGHFKESFKNIANSILCNNYIQKINLSDNLLNSDPRNIEMIFKIIKNKNNIKKFKAKGNILRIVNFDESINSRLIYDDFFI